MTHAQIYQRINAQTTPTKMVAITEGGRLWCCDDHQIQRYRRAAVRAYLRAYYRACVAGEKRTSAPELQALDAD